MRDQGLQTSELEVKQQNFSFDQIQEDNTKVQEADNYGNINYSYLAETRDFKNFDKYSLPKVNATKLAELKQQSEDYLKEFGNPFPEWQMPDRQQRRSSGSDSDKNGEKDPLDGLNGLDLSIKRHELDKYGELQSLQKYRNRQLTFLQTLPRPKTQKIETPQEIPERNGQIKDEDFIKTAPKPKLKNENSKNAKSKSNQRKKSRKKSKDAKSQMTSNNAKSEIESGLVKSQSSQNKKPKRRIRKTKNLSDISKI